MNIPHAKGNPKTRPDKAHRMLLKTKAKRNTAAKKAFEKARNTPKQPTAPLNMNLKKIRAAVRKEEEQERIEAYAKAMLGSHTIENFRSTQDIIRAAVTAAAGAHERLSNMTKQAEKPNTRRTALVKRRILPRFIGELEAVTKRSQQQHSIMGDTFIAEHARAAFDARD